MAPEIPDLKVTPLPATEGPFGNLLLLPTQKQTTYGRKRPPQHEEATISVGDLEVHIGTKPLCRDLRDLYDKAHQEFPADLQVFRRYDVWIVTHVVGALCRAGAADVRAFGYQVEFKEQQIYTVDLLPKSRFKKDEIGSVGVEVDLGLEGHAEVPEPVRSFLQVSESLGGDARLKFSTEAKFVGRLSFSVITPVVQVVGIGHSRCQWQFDRHEQPLLGDQLMFQTLLVPRNTPALTMRARGYALIRAPWTFIPGTFWTKWLDLEVRK
jgi:hypothetical protein